MFDETSGTWIKIYKVVTHIVFWLFMVGGVYTFIRGFSTYAAMSFYGIGIALGGFIYLATNMLIIQFLNNVQTIRETLESDD